MYITGNGIYFSMQLILSLRTYQVQKAMNTKETVYINFEYNTSLFFLLFVNISSYQQNWHIEFPSHHMNTQNREFELEFDFTLNHKTGHYQHCHVVILPASSNVVYLIAVGNCASLRYMTMLAAYWHGPPSAYNVSSQYKSSQGLAA